MILRGVDGCPTGWIAVSQDLDTGRVTHRVFKNAETETLLRDNSAEITAIDIPIGLPSDGSRKVDAEARKRLRRIWAAGSRASSVRIPATSVRPT